MDETLERISTCIDKLTFYFMTFLLILFFWICMREDHYVSVVSREKHITLDK